MKIKYLQILLLVIAFLLKNTEGVFAQQEGQHTLFMFNALSLNPGVAGSRDMPSFTLLGRYQWVGIKGAPSQQTLTYHAPAFGSQRLGLGLVVSNRSVGIFQSQTASMSWSYSPIRTKDFAMRMGLSGSVRRIGFKLETADQVTVLTNERSYIDLSGRTYGNFGMGAFFTYKDCYFGVSVPFFYSNVIGINTNTVTTAVEQSHFYVMGGLNLPIFNKISFRPAGIFKRTKNAPWSFDLNGSLVYDDKVTAGLSYRAGKSNVELGESLDFLLFYQINPSWGIGGAYDWNLSPLKKYTEGSFEVVMRYDLKPTALQFSNPRVFF